MSAEPTDEQVAAFKAAWHQADAEGDTGNRVRRGLEAALTAAVDTSGWSEEETGWSAQEDRNREYQLDESCEPGGLRAVVDFTDDDQVEADRPWPANPSPPGMGATRITVERQRQIDVEGWTPEHDDQWTAAQLAEAALCYLLMAREDGPRLGHVPVIWPWHPDWWKPSDEPIRNLEKAGALIAAEIDRLEVARADELIPVPDAAVTGNRTMPTPEPKETDR